MISKIFNKIASLILKRNTSSFNSDSAQSIDSAIGLRTKVLIPESKGLGIPREVEKKINNKVLFTDCNDKKLKCDANFYFAQDPDSRLCFWDYDYLQSFEQKNSLKYGGIPLCISPSQINIIKKTDAIYCTEEKCWFWPYKQNGNLNEIYPYLPRVYQMEENILAPNLVPEPLWEKNLRKYLDKNDWDFLRKHTYAQSGYRCSICGGKGEKWPVECDEVWNYQSLEDKRWASVLIGLRALCPRCHRVNHLGKANLDGKYDETIRHMAYINGWSLNLANHVANEAFKTFEERSKKTWLLGYENECVWDPSVEKVLKTFFSEVTAP